MSKAPTAYPLHWPDGWPRSKWTERSRFETTLPKALKNVQDSLRKFAADSGRKLENVVISSNYTLGGLDGNDAGVAVYFRWDGISTCIAVDRYGKIEDNLQAIHHVVEAERTKLRHGGLNLVRAAFRGYAALPPPGAETPWHEVLGVPPTASAAEINRAYRAAAASLHPDRGGSVDAMARLNAARDRALREART